MEQSRHDQEAAQLEQVREAAARFAAVVAPVWDLGDGQGGRVLGLLADALDALDLPGAGEVRR